LFLDDRQATLEGLRPLAALLAPRVTPVVRQFILDGGLGLVREEGGREGPGTDDIAETHVEEV
jgi:hypothetical protein